MWRSRAALGLCGELVLVGSGDAVLRRNVLGGDTHVDALERVGQHHDGAVDEGAVAEPVAVAAAEVVERHPAHRLGTAGHCYVEVVPAHLHRRRPDRLQAGAAEPVHGVGRRAHRQAGGHRDPTREVGVRPDLSDAAHDDLADVLAGYACTSQSLPDGGPAQLVGGHILQRTSEAAHRRAHSVNDDDLLLRHVRFLRLSGVSEHGRALLAECGESLDHVG